MMEESRTMVENWPPRRGVFTTLLKTRMESYGPSQPAVYGNSTVLTGSTSDLNPTYPLDPFVKRDLIKTERFGLYSDGKARPKRRSLRIFDPEAASSRRLRLIGMFLALLWTPMERS